MTKKDYDKAADIARRYHGSDRFDQHAYNVLVMGFIRLFSEDNPRFNEDCFRAKCINTDKIKV